MKGSVLLYGSSSNKGNSKILCCRPTVSGHQPYVEDVEDVEDVDRVLEQLEHVAPRQAGVSGVLERSWKGDRVVCVL